MFCLRHVSISGVLTFFRSLQSAHVTGCARNYGSISEGLREETAQALAGKSKKGKDKAATADDVTAQEIIKLTLHFKRFMYDPKKKMEQL